ncbi:MAG: Uma2 family endonuclease [Candidatus Competibacteraceae bacterium]|jgi:Uma2 family endonuclease|nr:Uma2 family endonuclease [Candidatus Competibacteraceae bacterium]
MSWAEICQNPILKDLPYKIQTDKWGNIVMSPASNEHGIYQAAIVALLSRLMNKGTIISECSVQTSEGTKVADVAWASERFMQNNKGKSPFDEAPEICVEILSPSNTEMEMEEKKELYFARGAKEFWICDKEGNIKFYKNTGSLKRSNIIEGFPCKLSS